jgi:hypothetical protein
MKKILFLLLCAGALNGMIRKDPEPSHYQTLWSHLPPEVIGIIFSYMHEANTLKEAVNNIKKLSLVSKELKQIVDAKYGNIQGFTALVHLLSHTFNIDSVEISYEFFTPIAIQYIQLWKMLLKAIRTNDIDAVRQLIAQGADVNGDLEGINPLSDAMIKQNPAIIKLLLENRLDVDDATKKELYSLIVHMKEEK